MQSKTRLWSDDKATADEGLPPDARIVAAARALFFAEGFAQVTTDRLAQEASVSKTTLYKYFGGMTGVLRAVVAAESENFSAGVSRDPRTEDEFRASLIAFGLNFLKLLDDPQTINFEQSILEQARAHPDVAQTFFEAAHQQTQRSLSGLIETGVERGFVRSKLSANDLAEHLTSLWKGARHAEAQLGLAGPRRRPVRDWVSQCVDVLFSGRG